MVAVVRRQVLLEVKACTHAMAVLELVLVEVFPLQTLLLLAVLAAHDLARHPERLAARPALRALLVLHLLLAGCLGKVEAAVAVAMPARAVQEAQEAVALAAVAVVQHAVHTPLALVA